MASCANATSLKSGEGSNPQMCGNAARLSIKRNDVDGRKGVDGTNLANAHFPLSKHRNTQPSPHEFYNMMLFHGNQKRENTLESL